MRSLFLRLTFLRSSFSRTLFLGSLVFVFGVLVFQTPFFLVTVFCFDRVDEAGTWSQLLEFLPSLRDLCAMLMKTIQYTYCRI